MKNSISEKLLLYKIRKIIVNEIKNPYYRNAANVREVIDLGTELIDSMTNKYQTAHHVRNIYIYKNDYVKFNNFIRTLGHLPEMHEFKYQKSYQKNRSKRKIS